MAEVEARVHVATPSRFLEEIARHWAKRYPARYDALTAEIELPEAQLVMTAGEEDLTFRLIGDSAAGIEEAKAMVVDHLDRIAAREGALGYDWQER